MGHRKKHTAPKPQRTPGLGRVERSTYTRAEFVGMAGEHPRAATAAPPTPGSTHKPMRAQDIEKRPFKAPVLLLFVLGYISYC